MKIAVGIPWTSPFMFADWFDGNMNMRCPAGCEMRWFRGRGWCPARRHIDLCEQAIAWGADYICIVGADQLHPEDMIERLVARVREGCEAVSALVPCRGYIEQNGMKPFQPMAWRFRRNATGDTTYRIYRGMEMDAHLVEVIRPEDGDIQQVNFIGSGVIMFHRDHLLALKKPWFMETVDPENMQRRGNMDCIFSWRLQHEGHATLWVDTTIKVQHLHVFRIDDSYQDRFIDWKHPGNGDESICARKKNGDSVTGRWTVAQAGATPPTGPVFQPSKESANVRV